MFLKYTAVTIILSLLSNAVYSQDGCEETLNNAYAEFNAGHFYGISAMVKPCIDNGFTKEQRQRAYLLLTQTYLLLDDPIGAEDSYLKLLRANPEFVAEPDREPIDVVYLSKKFTATPVFSLFGKIGGNASFQRVINDWTISGMNSERQRRTIRPGWQLSGGVDWNINENIALTFEAGYVFTAYKKSVSDIFVNDITEFIDRQHWISIPISVKYIYNKFKKTKPYWYLGYSANLLVADRASLIIRDRTLNSDVNGFSEESDESPVLNFNDRRNFFNRSAFIGAGVQHKSGLNYLFVDVRYSMGLSNLTNRETRYYDYSMALNNDNTPDELVSSGAPSVQYAYVDDDFRLDNLLVTVGFVKPLYKPRKLKVARTRSVMRTIRRQNN